MVIERLIHSTNEFIYSQKKITKLSFLEESHLEQNTAVVKAIPLNKIPNNKH